MQLRISTFQGARKDDSQSPYRLDSNSNGFELEYTRRLSLRCIHVSNVSLYISEPSDSTNLFTPNLLSATYSGELFVFRLNWLQAETTSTKVSFQTVSPIKFSKRLPSTGRNPHCPPDIVTYCLYKHLCRSIDKFSKNTFNNDIFQIRLLGLCDA